MSFNRSIGRPRGFFTINKERLRFHEPRFSILYTLSHYSYILGFIDNKFQISRRPNAKARIDVKLEIEQKKKTFKLLLLSLKELCENRGMELLTVYFPYKEQRKESIIQEILNELATRYKFHYLDFMNLFRDSNLEKSLYFSKDIHFNDLGHKFVAKKNSNSQIEFIANSNK